MSLRHVLGKSTSVISEKLWGLSVTHSASSPCDAGTRAAAERARRAGVCVALLELVRCEPKETFFEVRMMPGPSHTEFSPSSVNVKLRILSDFAKSAWVQFCGPADS